MIDPHRPVFVDPSGRRRRVVRIVAALAAALTVGYVALMLVAAFGGPDSPAARLPLLPGGPAAVGDGRGQPAAPVAPAVPPTTETGPVPTSDQAAEQVTAPTGPATLAPAATSSQHGRAQPKPTDPGSGSGGRPTDPPGNGG